MRLRGIVAILIIALGLNVRASGIETNMRATIDAAYTFELSGRHWLVVYGWGVANGWSGYKGVYVDRVLVGPGWSVERHDVADIVASWGWTADDGKPKQCDIAVTAAPCAACLGLWIEAPIAPGRHTVQLCVMGQTDDLYTPPSMTCDTRTVDVQ